MTHFLVSSRDTDVCWGGGGGAENDGPENIGHENESRTLAWQMQELKITDLKMMDQKWSRLAGTARR